MRPGKRDAGGFESLSLRDYGCDVIHPEVNQHPLRLLGWTVRLAVAVDDERRAGADAEGALAAGLDRDHDQRLSGHDAGLRGGGR